VSGNAGLVVFGRCDFAKEGLPDSKAAESGHVVGSRLVVLI
jgi:hypothetical protein